MKSIQIAICTTIFAVLIFGGISIGNTPFTPEGQKWEPAPEGHLIGKDNGEIFGSSGMVGEHFQGEDCGICHSPGKKAGDHVFTVSGTIFKDKLGIDPLEEAEVILKDVEGNVISITTPVESLLLVKPQTGSTHAGGGFWNLGDPEYTAIKQWIVEGAGNN